MGSLGSTSESNGWQSRKTFLSPIIMDEKRNEEDADDSEEFEMVDEENISVESMSETCDEEEEILDSNCSNCGYFPCRDGKMITRSDEIQGMDTKVAVPNCCKSYWGHGFRSQHGKIVKIDSLNTVTVKWRDDSVSQYNVYHTENPDNDSVLCFNCLEEELEELEDLEDDCIPQEDEDDAITDNFLIVSSNACRNCMKSHCLDGEVIENANDLDNNDCKVMVRNCSTDKWGESKRAQRGQVVKIDSPNTVTVRWRDDSVSQYNVYHTETPETDSVLCYNCLDEEIKDDNHEHSVCNEDDVENHIFGSIAEKKSSNGNDNCDADSSLCFDFSIP